MTCWDGGGGGINAVASAGATESSSDGAGLAGFFFSGAATLPLALAAAGRTALGSSGVLRFGGSDVVAPQENRK